MGTYNVDVTITVMTNTREEAIDIVNGALQENLLLPAGGDEHTKIYSYEIEEAFEVLTGEEMEEFGHND